jgi:CheY-like chemotaxis protein
VATAVTKGDLTQTIDVEARGEVAALKDNLNQMIRTLADTTMVNQEQDWLKTNLTRFTRMLQGQRDLLTVAQQVLSELARVVEAQHGVFFMAQKDARGETRLRLFASYAYRQRKHVGNEFMLGEGLVGQAAFERQRILVTDVPTDYITINSALGEARPLNLVVVPILFEGEVKGVIELASFQRFTDVQLAFLDQLLESLGIVVATIEATMRTDELLRQSQGLAEELKTQQFELQQTNEELEEKARQLTAQKVEVERKNQEVELAKQELEEKAEQLALTSRYKSEFLANMSHELRTPLNSLLILSRQLGDNRDGNLSDRQIEYARTIHQAGGDLLELINEILDLAKIESGTMAMQLSDIAFDDLRDYVDRSFRQLASEKGLALDVRLIGPLPDRIRTDDMRLKQVLRNLLSNAIKFTDRGHVRLTVRTVADTVWGVRAQGAAVVAFAVEDTGIGIPADKQRIIFEAFQQIDSGPARRYGGTGLGLSISREIAKLLGGVLEVSSEVGRGSVFTLYLPLEQASSHIALVPAATPGADLAHHASRPRVSAAVPDDRDRLDPGDRVIVVIEDDPSFAHTLLEQVREHGFRGVVCLEGREGLELAHVVHPSAILLDLRLPDVDGWVLLDRLKRDPALRHVPVHVLSSLDEERRAFEQGALSYLRKPVSIPDIRGVLDEISAFLEPRRRRLLIVEDDDRQRNALVDLVGGDDVEIVAVASGEEALERWCAESFDCVIVDLTLPGMGGAMLLTALQERSPHRRLPVIVYTGKELSSEELVELRAMTDSVIVKDASSPELLLDATARFLHRVEARLPEAQRRMLRRIEQADPALAGRHVLVVDDDFRNVFALTAMLEQHGMQVEYVENGRQALQKLGEITTDVVLMDIMMPEMDGYEAMQLIRARPELADLPIVALTAKAMQGDREKCIRAGASDYVTKPVDPDELVSLLRVWLNR